MIRHSNATAIGTPKILRATLLLMSAASAAGTAWAADTPTETKEQRSLRGADTPTETKEQRSLRGADTSFKTSEQRSSGAVDTSSLPKDLQRSSKTTKHRQSSRATEQQQIDALRQQLQAVQVLMKQLAEQNQALLQKLQPDEQRQTRGQVAAAAPSGGTTLPLGAPGAAVSSPSATPMPAPANGTAASIPSSTPTSVAATGNAAGGIAANGNAAFSSVRLWGYGELYYTRPSRVPARAQADLARAVFGIGYAFDAKTEFNSEYEVEHAVSSATDAGEFEVEQFYVDRQVTDAVAVRGGLFLMPFGLLNEHHEPTIFFGVQRNFVETLIIPSTWREGGFNVHGDTAVGLSWNVGLTTGFDLSKWDYAPEFPQYATALDLENSGAAPLQSTHQELSLANAQNLSQYIAVGYYGTPGLTLGAAIFTGNAAKVPAPPNAPILGNERVTLWETHVRWTPGKFDLSALYAHGSISNLGVANASNPGSPNPIPSDFYGYFAQAAYGLWEQGDYRVAPFIRWERYDMGSRYAGTAGPTLPAGLVPLSATPGDYGYWPQDHDRVWTVGANFYTTPHVVVKADYQWFRVNSDFDRFDLGLGLNF
jgi:phosphate-selective porin